MKNQFTFFKTIVIMLALSFLWVYPNISLGQLPISPGGSVSENFSIGSTANAPLPIGWKVDKSTTVRLVGSYNSALTVTDQLGGNSMSTTANNGIYNFGAGVPASAIDRSVGGLSSGSNSKSINIYVDLLNNGPSTIPNYTISYNVEKYRKGSNAAGFSIQMWYSTNGTTWTNAGANFLASFSTDADNTGYTTAPGTTTSISLKNLPISVAPNSHLYLAWNYSVTSGTNSANAQALGIDDVTISAAKTDQSITFSTLTNKTYGDSPYTLNATASSGLPISYSSSNNNVASVSGNTINIEGAGTCTIFANQAGNTNYNAAPQVGQSLTVNQASQSISFGTLAPKAYGNPTFQLSATGGGSGNPISFTSSPTGIVSIAGTMVTILNAGTCTIYANQAGNTNYSAAQQVEQPLTVNQAEQFIAFDGLPVKVLGNNPFALTAEASSGLNVSYSSSNENVATITGSTVTIVGIGITTITASQTGNTNYSAATPVSQDLTVIDNNYDVIFTVTDGTAPLAYAEVDFNGSTITTGANGLAVFYNVPIGTFPYIVRYPNFSNITGNIFVINQNVAEYVGIGTSVPTTHLTTGSCGLITSSKTSILSTYKVSGAQAYEFEFTNNDLPFQLILSNSDNPALQYVRLYMVTGIKYGRMYSVRSRVKVNNMWSAWSPSCSVTLNVPTTSITPGCCGISTTSLNTIVSTYIRTGAQAYEFEFTNSEGFLQTLSNTDNPIFQYVRLYMITGIKYGRTYNIRSRVKIDDMWSDWSSEVCQLTLNVPVTSITTGSCGLITTNTNSIISAYIVANTQAYQFEFTNAGLVFTRTLTNPSNPTTQYVRLYMVPGILRGYTYIVKVRIMVDGMWGAWSNTCNVTLNNISKQNEQGQSFIASNTDFVTYPNPFTENVILYINGPSDTEYIITAYDITGKILYNSSGYSGQEITFGKEWVKGMYIISVNGPDYAGSSKVIKTE